MNVLVGKTGERGPSRYRRTRYANVAKTVRLSYVVDFYRGGMCAVACHASPDSVLQRNDEHGTDPLVVSAWRIGGVSAIIAMRFLASATRRVSMVTHNLD